jgi:outer membrane immunogenic protein
MTITTKFARRTAAVAGLAALFAASTANAADIIMDEPPAPAAMSMETAPLPTWSGAYAGVSAAYGFNGEASGVIGDDVETDGFAGSGFVGYNMQSGSFVYGVEGDVGYSGVEGSNGINRVESGLNGSIRARMGVAVTDTVLVYGTAGGAAENVEVSNAAGSDDKTMLGYTVGAGVDAKLTDQVFGRVEYRYSDYGSETFNTGGIAQNVDTRDHKVSVGLGIKF